MGSQTTGPKGSGDNRAAHASAEAAAKSGSEVVTRRSDMEAQDLDSKEGPGTTDPPKILSLG